MFRRSERIWKQYTQHTSAVNVAEAIYLLHYFSLLELNCSYFSLIEIIDVQRYRIVRNKDKVYQMLLLPDNKQPAFQFPFHKN
jgi:hypothetical protein